VLLAGANNTGKSALLSALDLVIRGGTPTMARHAASLEPAQVRARFVLSEDERARLLTEVSDQTITESEAFSWFELVYVEAPDRALHASELYTAWPGRPPLLLARLDVDVSGNAQLQVIEAVNAILNGQPLRDLVGGRDDDPLARLDLRVGGSLPDLPDPLPPYMPRLSPFIELLAAWRGRYYHFGALRQGTSWTHPLRSTPTLDPTGSNLPAVLVDLQHNRPAAWARVQQLVEQIVPDVGLLETRTDNDQVEVVFADPTVPGYRPNLKNLGTGVEQLLMTIVVGVTQPAPSIVVIEEPETNLHHGAQRALLAQLREWSSDRLFVLSTHSPVFLDRASTTSTVLLVERTQGASTVRQLTRGPSEALTALGVQLSEALSADRLLLVEGEPDREILTVWFPELLSDPRMEVVIGHGGDKARFAGTLEQWLQALDRQDARRVLFLRDRDELASAVLDRLDADPAVHVLRRRELENYLLDADAVAAALLDRRVLNTAPADPQVVAQVLREGADRLKPVVVLKRIAAEVASRRLVDRKLVADLVQQGPTLEQFRETIRRRLPSEYALDEITQQWLTTEKDLEAAWEERWQDFAPGSDVLTHLWRAYGRAYDKLSDGLAIARHTHPPTELVEVIRRFLAG
jgi:AAA domain, putative AbiEii toxin, Type IV TA system